MTGEVVDDDNARKGTTDVEIRDGTCWFEGGGTTWSMG